jgi:KDO2-lipid IV(A) lauroyltransferase
MNLKKTLTRAALVAAGTLPLPLLHAAGAALGTLLWLLPTPQRAVTRRHLERCLPELSAGQRRRIAHQSLRHSMKAVFEAPAIWFGPRARLRRWLEDPALRTAFVQARASGALILCPHLGSWELAGMFCAENGGITSLYKPQKGVVDELIRVGRGRLGAQLVPTSGAGVKALLQALKRGETIGVLPDHDPPWGSGAFAPLFGIPAHTTELVSKLAGRSGAPVWFCYAERRNFGRGFRLHLAPAPAAIGDPEKGAAALNSGVEAVIRHLPDQYWWSYKRYRRRPPGAEDFYAGL